MFGFGWKEVGTKKKGNEKDQLTAVGAFLQRIPVPVLLGGLGAGCWWLYEKLTPSMEPDQVNAVATGTEASFDFASYLIGAGSAAAGSAVLSGAAYWGLHQYHIKRALQDMCYLKITPHAATKTYEDRIQKLMYAFWRGFRPWWVRLFRGREWFQLFFICHEGSHDEGTISLYLAFPRDRWDRVAKPFKSAYPNAELTEVTQDQIPVSESEKSKGQTLTWNSSKDRGFPLQSFQGKEKMADILNQLKVGTSLALTFSPAFPKQLKKQVEVSKKQLFKEIGFHPKTMHESQLEDHVKNDLDKLKKRARSDQYPFEVNISIHDQFGRKGALEAIKSAINTEVATQNSLDQNRWNPLQPKQIQLAPQYMSQQMIWTGLELANLLHLPNGKSAEEHKAQIHHIYDRIEHIMHGQTLLPLEDFTSGLRVGNYLNPAQGNRTLYVPEEQFCRHGVIIGKTGEGKTALALDIAQDRIEARLERKTGGMTIIDPKRTFALNLLTRINKLKVEGKWAEEQEEFFHYFDITSEKYAFGLNPLERPHGKVPNRSVAEGIVQRTLGVMRAAWAHESILFERFGHILLKALLADPTEQHTILALPEIIREESPLRTRLIRQLAKGDSYTKEIARDLQEEEKKGSFKSTRTESLINRLTKIKESAILRRIFGQKKTTLLPLKYMEEGHIVLFNIESLTPELTTILMGYIMCEYDRAARVRKNKSSNHYVLMDEAHRLKDLEVLHTSMIPELRECGLPLLFLTQMLHQFPKEFFDALTEIAGFFASCKSGTQNAAVMDRITNGRLNAQTLVDLETLTAAIEATNSKKKRVSFLIRSHPPVVYHKNGLPTFYDPNQEERTGREKEKAFTDCLHALGYQWMARDCKKVAEVEQDIDNYIGSLLGETKQPSAKELLKQAKTPARKKNNKLPVDPFQFKMVIPKIAATSEEENND